MFTHDLNLVAFLVAGIVPMVVGFLWYGPLFGKDWMALTGITEDKAKAAGSKALVFSVILSFVLSYVMQRVLSGLAVVTMSEAVLVAAMCWLGFAFTMTGMNVVYELRPMKLLVIYSGYALVAFIGVAVVQMLFV